MAPLPDYVAGTITLTNGSTAFTGSGTGWLAAGFREGDTILGIEDNPGVVYVVESVTDNDSGTLTQPWDGPTGTYTYRMRYLSDGQRVTAQARQLIEMLGNGNLQAVAGLPGTPNTFMMFTGAGSVVEVPRTDLVSGANYDVQVDTLAERAAYDGSDEGFAVLVANTGDGRAAIYSKLSNAVGDWSVPAYVTGPAVTLGVGSVTPVAFGNDPDVTLTPVAGGYEFDFELPENATFQSGTITTLPPGSNATFSLSPVEGGYALNLGVPRGPTGDINGVTPFWQGRITVDANAAAARAGLGALGVGAFGLGSTGQSIINSGSWDDLVTTGFYYVAGSGAVSDGPGGTSNAIVIGQSASGGRTTQIASIISAPGLRTRQQTNGVWSDWIELSGGSVDQLFTDDLTAEFDVNEKAQARENIDALGPGEPADRAFRRGNILGTVSQSGGVPTGEIIERGSNANGEYVRYADGTQICWKSETIIAQGDVAIAPWDWTFPAAFGSPPVPTSGFQPVNVSGSNRRFVLISQDITETTVRLVVTVLTGQSNFTSGDELRIDCAAHGRWF